MRVMCNPKERHEIITTKMRKKHSNKKMTLELKKTLMKKELRLN